MPLRSIVISESIDAYTNTFKTAPRQVPEALTLFLMGAGLIGLGARRRR